MIKPDWNNFKAKFSDNPQKNFEWFCYLLFCKEFDKTFGIFRYKNQSAIETNPIEKDGRIIGWQAKFFDKALSKHKVDLSDTLDKANQDYPQITKLVLYTNQEWGQKKGKEPQGKKDIDKKAQELGIELEWRTASYFESPFVSTDCELISKHFFSIDKSILNLLQEQKLHSENILSEIQTSITFNDSEIEIDRTKELEKINTTQTQTLILSGVGGVGKTALIKKSFVQNKDKIPIYIFKATEFELRNINEFFVGYTIQDFLEAHKDESLKIIVIDSAEKLLDLKNTDPFKEFLSVLLKNNWKIIFTTRDNYLEDLNYQLIQIYKIVPLHINLRGLDSKELNAFSEQFKFSLPKDEKLFEFIKNPFYLNEFLRFYKENEEISYTDFKNKLWNRVILKAKPAREQCFLRLVFGRVNDGQFFVNPNCETQILDELRNDGILGYESPHGYFITHDIYEEWALEKIIEAEFEKRANDKIFFENIGSSLPIRRAFRKWLSENLLLENSQIKTFIEQALCNKEIESFWKDEILVAVLLSDYSYRFFDIFKDELLSDKRQLLTKLSFLLRIACKEIDDEFFSLLGITNAEAFSSELLFTKPKGHGWKSFIEFTYNNIEEIGVGNIYFVLPVIYDWVSKFKEGETTRYSGLIALKYYQWIQQEDIYISNDEKKNNLLQTIIYSSSEINSELEEILKEIITNKWKNHNDPYYDLSKIILTKFEGAFVSKILPGYVLQLADLFWTLTPNKDDFYNDHSSGVEKYFGMEYDYLHYFPASSLQTPIYFLLQTSLKETVDFILAFTNKTVEHFAKSEFAKHEAEEVNVLIENDKPIKQYICNRLWCTFRGTQTSPHLLESMHMALEKYFLEIGKKADSQILESWLLYLLKNSISASISGIVASIVMAYPEKTFNVATILFRTKEFFLYDTCRFVLDQSAKSTILMLRSFAPNARNKIHDNERLKACDDSHRTLAVEHLFLNYQMFRSDLVSEDEAKRRQQVLWQILDNYYKELPEKSKETERDKTWRLYLARMDRRKMNIETEKTDAGYKITFNPELDKDLEEYSEESTAKTSELTRYTSLKIWANYKIKNDEKYKQFTQYENDPKLAIKEVKEILQRLKAETPTDGKGHNLAKGNFYLFNHAIPSEVCAVLLKFYFDQLSSEEAQFCSQVILEAALSTLSADFQYQSLEGIDSALLVLPIILDKFPKEREKIKRIVLMNLFNDYPIDMYGTRFNTFSVMAIQELWKAHPDEANSILIGYLYLKPNYDAFFSRIRRENYEKNIYNVSAKEVLDCFLKENKEYIQKVITNQTIIEDVGEIETIDLDILNLAFRLIPLATENNEHKKIVKKIISAFARRLFSNDRQDRIEHIHEFLEKLVYYVLKAPRNEVSEYLKPLLYNFKGSEATADLFVEFISAEDYLFSYENFWEVWNLFKEKIINLCSKGDGYAYISRVVRSYLFAQNPWKETAVDWHTFKNYDSRFFKEMSDIIGHCPSTLYSISKLLDGIGSSYLDEGIVWISDMLKKNESLWNAKLVVDTIYYLENLVKKYVYKNREKIKKSKDLKECLLVILDFLIKKVSVVGYLVRESIL
jgi:hypothetical protein